jgi:aryl-alcohol dehydrogenase-like predicted oxidoreductase
MALGTMTFGSDWGWGADAEEAVRFSTRTSIALRNLIDSANEYAEGSAERLLGADGVISDVLERKRAWGMEF